MYPCHNFSRQILLYVPVSHYNTACVPPSAVSDNLYYSTSPPHIGMSCTSHIPYTPCSTSSPSVSAYSSSSFPIPPIVSSYSFPNNMPYSYTDTIYILYICHTLHIPCTPVSTCWLVELPKSMLERVYVMHYPPQIGGAAGMAAGRVAQRLHHWPEQRAVRLQLYILYFYPVHDDLRIVT